MRLLGESRLTRELDVGRVVFELRGILGASASDHASGSINVRIAVVSVCCITLIVDKLNSASCGGCAIYLP